MDLFSTLKSGAYQNLGQVVNGFSFNPLDFSSVVFENTIEDILYKAYRSNPTSVMFLKSLSDTLEPGSDYEKAAKDHLNIIRDKTEAIIKDANAITDKEISYTGLSLLLTYLQNLANNVSILNIKTEPFFNLVGPFIYGKPCLFLNHSNFHAFVSGIPTRGFLSGLYILTGYEHSISSSECHSKFDITRNVLATANMKSYLGKGTKGGF